jgi:hypothetical protein
MPKQRNRKADSRRKGLPPRVVAVAIGLALPLAAGIGVSRLGMTQRGTASRPPTAAVAPAETTERALSDAEVQGAADALLAATNPDLPDNGHFTSLARDTLRWLVKEHAAGRVVVAFLGEGEGDLPAGVFMVATRLSDRATLVIAKPMLARFLREGGRLSAPFTQQQRNDFVIGLAHEVIHLQRWPERPPSKQERATEEAAVWHQVSMQIVRPWRAANQPVNQRFARVDDAFRRCGDVLPCPELASLIRLAE